MGTRHFIRLIAILAVSAGITLPASAQEVTSAMTARDIAAALSNAGLKAEFKQDKGNGLPVALGKVDGINFVVRALDCDGLPAKCSQLLFFANFDLGREIEPQDYMIVNSFNDSNMDGRAYVIEETGEIGVDFYIDLTGGVTPAHISNRIGRWQAVIADFLAEMRAAHSGS